jgi:hypothetical protein
MNKMIKNVENAMNAALVTAAKNDIREYLNTVALWFDGYNNIETIVSTDGHTMTVIGNPERHPDDAFLLDRNDVSRFIMLRNTSCEMVRSDNKLAFGNIELLGLDRRFPDYRRQLLDVSNVVPTSEIGFCTTYLTYPEKVRSKLWKGIKGTPKFRNTHLHFYGSDKPVQFEIKGNDAVDSATVIIVPVRL